MTRFTNPALLKWTTRLACYLLATTFCATSVVMAHPAQEPAVLWGTIEDGPTGLPIAEAIIRIGDTVERSAEDGSYQIVVAPGEIILEVYALLPDGQWEELNQTGLILEPGDDLYRPIRLITEAYLSHPLKDDPSGIPWSQERPRPIGDLAESQPIDLYELWRERAEDPRQPSLPRAELPEILPTEIRIGRRFASSCAGNPVQRIDTIDLETYAAGVVTAEIGVFRHLTTGQASAYECFKTFAVAGVSYALWFYARNPDAEYHLDDTACNQRYDDGPYPEIIREAVQEVLGQVLIKAGTTATIDKYEYAASCGRHGTRPAYQTEIIPDIVTEVEACTSGGWCGHNNCAAHEDNPDVPGDDRCLVRGICQWGSAERSARGDSYLEILQHYQPHLVVRSFGGPSPTRLMGFVRNSDIYLGEGIQGAHVELDTHQFATTDSRGYYVFDEVLGGTRTLTISAPGYQPLSFSKEVAEGIDNWASSALAPDGSVEQPDEDLPEPLDEPIEYGPDLVEDMGLDTPEQTEPDLYADLYDAVDSHDSLFEDGPAQVESERDSMVPLSRFAQVGPSGLSESACSQIGAGPLSSYWLVVFLVTLGLSYWRRKRTPN